MRINKLYVLLIATFICSVSYTEAQNESKNDALTKYRIGLFYEHLSFNLRINSIKYHSVWDGIDLGTRTLNEDDISDVNSISDIRKIVQGPLINFGYAILNKKENPFFIEIGLAAGFAFKNYEIVNTETDEMVQSIKSEKVNHWYGVSAKIIYNINKTWGIQLTPSINYSWGISEDIIDKINPILINYSENRSDKSNIFYARTQLMALCALKNITILVGPGFYYAINNHEFTIERTNLEDNSTNIDIYEMKLQSKQFVDLSVGFNWHFMRHISVNATCGLGNDYFIFSGITYLF